MKTYKFPKDRLVSIMSHIEGFQITILSMAPEGEYYIIDLDCNELPEGQYEHLNDQYQFQEVI